MDTGITEFQKTKTRREVEYHRLRKWEMMTLENRRGLQRILSRIQERYNIVERLPQLLEPPAAQLQEAVEFYSSLNDKDLDSIYVNPRSVPEVHIGDTEVRGFGEVLELSFQSDFEPLFSQYLPEFESHANNKQVFARIWRQPHGVSKGTLIAIPGWYMADPRLGAIALMPGLFFSLGYNVVLYELPYTHRRMTSPTQVFPSSNLIRTNEGIFQAIYELRQIRSWLEENGEYVTGVLGSSFGGYLAALWSSLDVFDNLITVSAVCDLLSTVETLFSSNAEPQQLPGLSIAFEKIFARVSKEELASALRVHSPMSRKCKTPVEKRLLIAATEDMVVGSDEVKKLQAHLQSNSVCWVPGGHFGQLCRPEAQKRIQQLLA